MKRFWDLFERLVDAVETIANMQFVSVHNLRNEVEGLRCELSSHIASKRHGGIVRKKKAEADNAIQR